MCSISSFQALFVIHLLARNIIPLQWLFGFHIYQHYLFGSHTRYNSQSSFRNKYQISIYAVNSLET